MAACSVGQVPWGLSHQAESVTLSYAGTWRYAMLAGVLPAAIANTADRCTGERKGTHTLPSPVGEVSETMVHVALRLSSAAEQQAGGVHGARSAARGTLGGTREKPQARTDRQAARAVLDRCGVTRRVLWPCAAAIRRPRAVLKDSA